MKDYLEGNGIILSPVTPRDIIKVTLLDPRARGTARFNSDI